MLTTAGCHSKWSFLFEYSDFPISTLTCMYLYLCFVLVAFCIICEMNPLKSAPSGSLSVGVSWVLVHECHYDTGNSVPNINRITLDSSAYNGE
jgi:hypothetical protein